MNVRAIVAGLLTSGGLMAAALTIRHRAARHRRAGQPPGSSLVKSRVSPRRISQRRRESRRSNIKPDRDLAALYDRYFCVVPATTPHLLDATYALRYRVYCVEHGFEDPSQQLGEREMDRYDAHSVHAVLIYRPTADVVGCVRLILPQPGEGLSSLPIRALIGEDARARLDQCDPARTAEISRYAVSKMFRHREGEDLYPDVHAAELPAREFRRLVPHVSLGLLRGVASLAAERGITTVCAAMAPSLRRLLDGLGLTFEPLGPLVDYHGQRQPCLADCETLLAGMAARHAEYYRLIDAAYHGTPSRRLPDKKR